MPTLPSPLRSLLENRIVAAERAAREAADAALRALAVDQPDAFPGMNPADSALREALRAEARRLGDKLDALPDNPFPRLADECAYEQWHRMLFARFLAENGLLMHPAGVPVTLADCAELAADEGEPDAWAVAAKYAAGMLPGIFRNEDPVLRVRLAPEGRHRLEALLAELPSAVFTAEDSLGWCYQFWQTRAKQEVNKSERKASGPDISAVTQLFTEPYMVQFLLHNTLGAWWLSKDEGGRMKDEGAPPPHAQRPMPNVSEPSTINHQPSTETHPHTHTPTHPHSILDLPLDYLRLADDGTPAAGSFPGWPRRAAELKVMDPCCGSGHFLVAAFEILRRMRMVEEGLSEADAADAVLRDNLFGLELDPRCTQIAAFNLALAAWKAGGYRDLPLPNVACSGIPVGDRLYEWIALAEGDPNLEAILRRLYEMFRDAPDLGSLIDPSRAAVEEGLFAFRWDEVRPLLDEALATESPDFDPAAAVFGAAARGAARTAQLLAEKYHLVSTNVPYLTRQKQSENLRVFIDANHYAGRADLATAFVQRCLGICKDGGSTALVTPQSWLFLGSYKQLREWILRNNQVGMVARLGTGAFETIGGSVVNIGLFIVVNRTPEPKHCFIGLDAGDGRSPADKASILHSRALCSLSQYSQLAHPDACITLKSVECGPLLEAYVAAHQGICTGDTPRFYRTFWELAKVSNGWVFLQSSVDQTCFFGGRTRIFLWEDGVGEFAKHVKTLDGRLGGSWRRGSEVWGKRGVIVSQMNELSVTLYSGEHWDNSSAVIIPKNPLHLAAVWAFCSSPEFCGTVRQINQKLNVDPSYLVRIPFDLQRWQQVAEQNGPLPEPHSDDPTQWLFDGHPPGSTEPLQVAAARLLGYRWPEQKEDGLDAFADADGIVCLPPVAGEVAAHERLRALLAAAHGEEWSPALQEQLLSRAGSPGKSLEAWLRDDFFTQHCRLFHNRPFLWHVWDGRRDGFSVLLNYHRLDRARLERLAYTVLGDWISAQREASRRGEAGADGRLVAAETLKAKLEAILHGEPPHDVYVRWKGLEKQPLGWEPDLNDGVRLNIRPWVTAGVLRAKFTVHWNKDRGKNPDGTERLNDRHYTRAEKEAARRRAGNA